MLVKSVEQIGKEKFKVEIEEKTLILYKSDIRRYEIEEQKEIDLEQIEKMLEKRAKMKVLEWLKFSNRTKEELIQKLRQAGYGKEIAEKAISYVDSYGYLDDQRYARNYIEYKGKSKSKKQLELELKKKGLNKEEIEQSMEESQYSESYALEKAFQKKIGNRELNIVSYEEKQKIAAYLLRKGFSFEDVRHKLFL